jgi:hypothetical protein
MNIRSLIAPIAVFVVAGSLALTACTAGPPNPERSGSAGQHGSEDAATSPSEVTLSRARAESSPARTVSSGWKEMTRATHG